MQISKLTIGVLLSIGSAFFFTLMSLFIKLGSQISPSIHLFARSLILTVTCYILVQLFNNNKVKRKRIKLLGKKTSQWALFTRTFVGLAGMYGGIYSVQHLTLADADIINKLSAVFTIILSATILKDKTTFVHWVLVIMSFVGLVFVIKPTLSLNLLPYIIGLAGAFCAGVAYLMVRILGTSKHLNEHPFTIMFHLSLYSTLITLPGTIISYDSSIDLIQYVYVFLMALSAAGTQLCITYSYRFAAAKEVSIYSYLSVPFNMILGLIIFTTLPDVYSLIGYVVIVSSGLIMYYYNLRLHRKEKAINNI